jgi:hypothetical protein
MTIAHKYVENLVKLQYLQTTVTKVDNMPFELKNILRLTRMPPTIECPNYFLAFHMKE